MKKAGQRKKVFLVITDAGGGHRGTANSLKAAIEKRKLPWDVRVVNVYQEVWKDIEPGLKYLRTSGEDVYNFVLRHNLIIWAGILRVLARLAVRLNTGRAAGHFRRFVQAERPDLVVSLMPFVNDTYARAVEGTGVPFALLATDLLDTEPYMWFTPLACRRARFVAVGARGAADQALSRGAGERLLESGLVIHPKYFEPGARTLPRGRARARFGLDQDLFTVMILMGGWGSTVIRHFVEKFEAAPGRWQVVACCGKNQALKEELESRAPGFRNKVVPVGFSLELHRLMRASDLLITKPGPASIMEGVAMNVPLVLDHFQTMPQERPNVGLVEREGLGVVVSDRRRMFDTVRGLWENPDRLEEIRRRQRAYRLKDASVPVIRAMRACLEGKRESADG